MMPKFDLILLLLLAKSFAQENPGPLFKAVGKTLELGFCFGVDYLIAYKIYEGEKQLLWNSSDSASLPDAYKNRFHISSSSPGLLGFQLMDLDVSDSGEYLRECWLGGKPTNRHSYYLYICYEEMEPQELSSQNGSIVLDCDTSYSEREGASVTWFREVYPGYKTSLILDTARQIGMETELIYDSEDPSIDIPHDMISRTQILDSNGSLILTELDEKDSGKYWCVVLLDSVEEEADDSEDYEDEEQDSVEPIDYWVSDEENGEKCIIKRVTNLNIQSNQSRIETTKSDSETSPVTYAVIGCVFGIVILGLIIFVVVAKMRAKRKASDSNRTQSTAQQKENRTASAPLM
ncbi:hypothetical protein HF521_003716 [Silurus meridionalis]|uniref:Ig-like domain-containing protein n=1 Tax=Silurus meridionalis TaxID=175797 RepID=A0A8T0B0Q5_SILME|nr:hypothetical protein HF521_003716 [Silurus meridionalis]